MKLTRTSLRPWLCFIAVGMLGTPGEARSAEHVAAIDDPYGYVAFDQDVKEALALFAAERDIALDITPAVRGRLKGRVAIANGRELLDSAARASQSVWHYDGRRLLFRRASASSTRRIAAGHLGESHRQKLMRHLHQAGSGAGLSYDPLTRDLVVQGPAEFIDAVARAISPAPSRKPDGAVAVHRFGTR